MENVEPRTFVMGDIHGAYRGLQQCLSRANFNYDTDYLIALGDVADGWSETKQCINELLKIRNLTFIFGNHDFWALQWMETGVIDEVWYEQGGKATIDSYNGDIPEAHILFLKKAQPYYILDGKVFVHAGINPTIPLEKNSLHTLLWDRNFARMAFESVKNGSSEKLSSYNAVYIGHTPISGKKPLKANDVWFMDTGAGWSGVLSIMNIETEEFFTSDPIPELYPGVKGRKKRD